MSLFTANRPQIIFDECVRDSQRERELEEIVSAVRGLPSIQLSFIRDFVRIWQKPIFGELERDSQYPGNGLIQYDDFRYFAVRLASHHAYSTRRFKKENFEHVLIETFNRLRPGSAYKAHQEDYRGADIFVNNEGLSLKTEGAKGMKMAFIHISKLMESGWLRQCKDGGQVIPFVHSQILPHFDHYNRMFILRGYPDPTMPGYVRYDLHEIPIPLLRHIADLQEMDFVTGTGRPRWTVPVRDGNRVAFKLRFDRSVEKITLTGLPIDQCPRHAWWSVYGPTTLLDRSEEE